MLSLSIHRKFAECPPATDQNLSSPRSATIPRSSCSRPAVTATGALLSVTAGPEVVTQSSEAESVSHPHIPRCGGWQLLGPNPGKPIPASLRTALWPPSHPTR